VKLDQAIRANNGLSWTSGSLEFDESTSAASGSTMACATPVKPKMAGWWFFRALFDHPAGFFIAGAVQKSL
jgi:hypothetical protein